MMTMMLLSHLLDVQVVVLVLVVIVGFDVDVVVVVVVVVDIGVGVVGVVAYVPDQAFVSYPTNLQGWVGTHHLQAGSPNNQIFSPNKTIRSL